MKATKKLLALLLALTMVFGLATTAFADVADQDPPYSGDSKYDKGTIVIQDPEPGVTYHAYRLLELESWADKTYDPDSNGESDPPQDEFNQTGNYVYKLNAEWAPFFGYRWDTTDSQNPKWVADTNDETNKTGTYAPGYGFVTVELPQGYVTWKEGDVPTFAAKAMEWADNHKDTVTAEAYATAPDPATGDGKLTLTTDGGEPTDANKKLPLGWYLVDSSLGALCSLGTTDNVAEIWEKQEETTHRKEVRVPKDEDIYDGTDDGLASENTASIGDTVRFKATILVEKGATGYVYHDKMCDGLTFNNNVTVAVRRWNKARTALENAVAITLKDDYTVVYNGDAGVVHEWDSDTDPANLKDHPWKMTQSTDDESKWSCKCTFDVVFTEEFLQTVQEGEEIIIDYDATLNDKAEILQINENDSVVKYGDDQFTEPDATKTYTYRVNVWKFWDENGATDGGMKNLPGADFVLYQVDNDTNPTKYYYMHANNATANGTPGTWYPEDITEVEGDTDQWFNSDRKLTYNDFYDATAKNDDGSPKQNAAFHGTIMKSEADGYVKIDGLDEGTYYLEETKAPNGFNQLLGPIKITITAIRDTNAPKEITGVEVKYYETTADGSWGTAANATVKYKLDGDGKELIPAETPADPSEDANYDADHVVRVQNNSGREMPRTGGMGTTLFYVFGGLLTAAAVVLLITKKRVNG